MENYMDGEWHNWYGGECPVPKGTMVEIECSGYPDTSKSLSENCRWARKVFAPISRFRVLSPVEAPNSPADSHNATSAPSPTRQRIIAAMDAEIDALLARKQWCAALDLYHRMRAFEKEGE